MSLLYLEGWIDRQTDGRSDSLYPLLLARSILDNQFVKTRCVCEQPCPRWGHSGVTESRSHGDH